jgi:CRISPR system Cascade subunit CasA
VSHFNLIDEPWIPIRDLLGARREVGLKEVLLRASDISEIEDVSPLVVAALYRFLLAVLYRALEGPKDIDEARTFFREGFPSSKIEEYLEKWRGRFYLFDESYPFGQIPTVWSKELRSWTTLAAEHNADNAKVLFDHVDTRNAGPITCASAIRWLIATHTFSVSAGKSELSHTGTAPSATAAMTIPIGANLRDTLHFLLVFQNRLTTEVDLPIWERNPESIDVLRSGLERTPCGYADLFTWRTRSVRLVRNESGQVEKVAFASGVSIGESSFDDPMLAFRLDEKRGKLPIQFKERGLWREFDSLLPDAKGTAPRVISNALAISRDDPKRAPKALLVIGQRNDKALIEFWRNERFVLPIATDETGKLRDNINGFLGKCEEVGTVLYKACRTYFRHLLSRGSREPIPQDLRGCIESCPATQVYWSLMEADFHALLSKISAEGVNEELRAWWLRRLTENFMSGWDSLVRSIDGGDVWSVRALAMAERSVRMKRKEMTTRAKEYEGNV